MYMQVQKCKQMGFDTRAGKAYMCMQVQKCEQNVQKTDSDAGLALTQSRAKPLELHLAVSKTCESQSTTCKR